MNSATVLPKQQIIERMKEFICRQFQLQPEQVEEMLPDFIATLASHLKNLENSLTTGDPVTIGKAGHTIKGALLNLGLEDVAALALSIENLGKSGDRNIDYASLINQLRGEINPLFH